VYYLQHQRKRQNTKIRVVQHVAISTPFIKGMAFHIGRELKVTVIDNENEVSKLSKRKLKYGYAFHAP